jgi:hypothetical protein
MFRAWSRGPGDGLSRAAPEDSTQIFRNTSVEFLQPNAILGVPALSQPCCVPEGFSSNPVRVPSAYPGHDHTGFDCRPRTHVPRSLLHHCCNTANRLTE